MLSQIAKNEEWIFFTMFDFWPKQSFLITEYLITDTW